jgi:hypothetical protein
VLVLQRLQVTLRCGNLLAQRRIRLLACQKPLNDILNVSNPRTNLDPVKGGFKPSRAFLLLFKPLFQNLIPKLLDAEHLPHFDLLGVFVFGSGVLCHLCLAALSILAATSRLLTVTHVLLQFDDTLISSPLFN